MKCARITFLTPVPRWIVATLENTVRFLGLFLAPKPFRPYFFFADGPLEFGLECKREVMDTEETFPRTDQAITSPFE